MDRIDVFGIRSGSVQKIASLSAKNATHSISVMGKDEITVSIITDAVLQLQVGDYLVKDGVTFRMNRDAEFTQHSENSNEYFFIFEAPIYTLLDKIACHKITGSTKIILTGKLRDFLELIIWNINKSASNTLGIDAGWTIGRCPETEYKNLIFDGITCRAMLDELYKAFNLEYYISNKTINFVEYVEKDTSLVFTQGRGRGLYSLEQRNVDEGDVVTRVYAKGGTHNVSPGEGDEDGRLMLPEKYIENFTQTNKVVERVVVFDDIHPTFQGVVGELSGEHNKSFICSSIDFDIKELAVGSDARVNFLTGDLMGKAFEFEWSNEKKQITLIGQVDELALIDPSTNSRPVIPDANKYLRGGEKFTLTGLRMSGTYKENAVNKLRQKAISWLDFHSRKRVKYNLEVDHRWLRGKQELQIGSLVRIKDTKRGLNAVIRVTSIERNLGTGKLSCVVSNYIDERWEKKIEGQIAAVQSVISGTSSSGGSFASAVIDILDRFDNRELTDNRVFSSLRTIAEIAERALSSKESDTAVGLITFLSGLQLGVQGGRISELGDAELRNLVLRIKAVIPILEATTTTTNSLEASTVRTTEITNKSKITTLNLLVQALAEMHSLTVADTARIMRGVIRDTLSSETFASGFAGNGFRIYKEAVTGDWNLEIDNVIVRKLFHVFELRVQRITHQGGMVIKSPAGGKITKVEDKGNYWRIEHDGLDDFATNDLALCQAFKFIGDGGKVKRYWRAVWTTGKGFAHISKNDCEAGSADPEVGDEIVVFGNKTNPARQSAQVDCVIGENAPYRASYAGINSYSIVGKEVERTGNLSGIIDADFGALSGYGLYASRAYIKGQLRVMSGQTIEEYTRSAIENIELGGRNLIKKSQEVVSATHSFQLAKSWLDLKGKTVVLSFEYEYNNVSTGTTYSQMRFGVERNLTMPGSTFYARAWVDLPASSMGLSSKGRCIKILTLPADFTVAQDKDLGAYVQVLGGNVRMWNFKLEEGNKATAWTPAPEDFTDEISTVRSDFEVREGVISAKVQEAKTAAQQAQNNATAVQQTATQVEIKATQAQQSATQANATLQQVNAKAAIINTQAGQIDLKVQETTTKASEAAKAAIIATAMSKGKRLNSDAAFRKGVNGLTAYDNKRSGLVKLERVASAEGNPSASTHMLKITTRYGEKVNNQPPYAPGYGGFYFGTQTRANAVFLARFIAKIPDKFILQHNTNPTGTGAKARWLTSQLGTGKWEEYAILLECGSSGTFSTTFFFALYNRISNSTHPDTDPTPDNPITWYVSSATVYDCTDADADWQAEINARPTTEEIKSNITLTPDKISVFGKLLSLVGMVTFNAFDAATQSKITALSDEVARSLGYASAQDAISQTAAGKTIISGGYLNTELLKANAIEAKHIAAEAITADKIKSKSLTSAHINVGELWAKILKTEDIEANVVKCGVNTSMPHGYNIFFDKTGRGDIGAFFVEGNEVGIRDAQNNTRVLYSRNQIEDFNTIKARGSFAGTYVDRNLTLTLSEVSYLGSGFGTTAAPTPVGFTGGLNNDFPHFGSPRNEQTHTYRASGTQQFVNIFSVTKDGTEIEMKIKASHNGELGTMTAGFATIAIVDASGVAAQGTEISFNQPDARKITFKNLKPGVYAVKLSASILISSTTQYDNPAHPTISVELREVKWKANAQEYRRVAYFPDGWYISYPNILLYMSEPTGFVLSGRDVDIPGVLCAARVDRFGAARAVYGKRALPVGRIKPVIEYTATNGYRVHHSIGHSHYIPFVTPSGGVGAMVEMGAVTDTYFEFKMYNRNGAAVEGAFNYQCVGEND